MNASRNTAKLRRHDVYVSKLSTGAKARRVAKLAVGGLDKSPFYMKSGFVYMLKEDGSDLVKVGISRNPEQRVKAFAGFSVYWKLKTFDPIGLETILKALLHDIGRSQTEHLGKTQYEMFWLSESERQLVLVAARYINQSMMASVPMCCPTSTGEGSEDDLAPLRIREIDEAIERRANAYTRRIS